MPRGKNENSRVPIDADPGSDARTGGAADEAAALRRSEITDSHLGLIPSSERDDPTGGQDEVIGPDRDDLILGFGPAGLLPEDRAATEGTADVGPAGAAGGRRAEIIDEEPDLTTTAHGVGDDDRGASLPDVEPSLIDQELLSDPLAAMGSPDETTDPVAAGDEVYVPPTDPVITNDGPGGVAVLGGFSVTAAESVTPARSASDGQIGDEAIADAVRDALRLDAATTDLQVRVAVRDGIVYLRGSVVEVGDAENAEEVARRVEGIVDVVEELDVVDV